MKKAERILDLVAFLLHSPEPVTFEEIRQAFPEDYVGDNEATVARKFERDKADILALGLPIKHLAGDDHDKEGYLIERDSYGLPPLDLAPEELALLFLAGSAALDMTASPFARDLSLALNKIAFSFDAGVGQIATLRSLQRGATKVLPEDGLRQRENLEALQRAIRDRKTVTLSYHGLWRDEITKRRVDPYGLVYRQGDWILVGHCHLREAPRVFHVRRLRGLAVNPLKPKSPDFEVPSGFKLRQHVARHPWQLKVHEPKLVRIRMEGPVAQTLVAELGEAVSKVEEDGEALILSLSCSNTEGFLPLVIGQRARARVLEPPELVERVREVLTVLSQAGEAPL